MDTINVAILKNGSVISSLVFGPQNTDEEIQQFAEIAGGDSFLKLEYNQVVVDNTIVTLEQPSPDWTWSEEIKNWVSPPQETTENDEGGTLEDFQEWQRRNALEEGN